MFHFRRISDDEYVARIRKGIAFWDRFRVYLLVLYILLLAAASWLFADGILLLKGMVAPMAPMGWLGFTLGMVMGIVFGIIIHSAAHGIISTLGGLRSERLMVEFYDRLNTQPTQPTSRNEDPQT